MCNRWGGNSLSTDAPRNSGAVAQTCSSRRGVIHSTLAAGAVAQTCSARGGATSQPTAGAVTQDVPLSQEPSRRTRPLAAGTSRRLVPRAVCIHDPWEECNPGGVPARCPQPPTPRTARTSTHPKFPKLKARGRGERKAQAPSTSGKAPGRTRHRMDDQQRGKTQQAGTRDNNNGRLSTGRRKPHREEHPAGKGKTNPTHNHTRAQPHVCGAPP